MENIDKKVLIEILKKQLEINEQLMRVINSCSGLIGNTHEMEALRTQINSLKETLGNVQ